LDETQSLSVPSILISDDSSQSTAISAPETTYINNDVSVSTTAPSRDVTSTLTISPQTMPQSLSSSFPSPSEDFYRSPTSQPTPSNDDSNNNIDTANNDANSPPPLPPKTSPPPPPPPPPPPSLSLSSASSESSASTPLSAPSTSQ
jgi:hypothetical protein